MVLKKQTVWLLTMLSLVVVLSVYYVTSPGQSGDDYALMTDGQEQEDQEIENMDEQTTGSMDGTEVVVEELNEDSLTSGLSSDEFFTSLRMEINDQRARLKEELQSVVASSDVTAEKKSEALDKMQALHTMATKEAILETMITSNANYADALVKAEDSQVRVIVKANEHSNTAANEIIKLVRDELGNKQVAVEFQPVN